MSLTRAHRSKVCGKHREIAGSQNIAHFYQDTQQLYHATMSSLHEGTIVYNTIQHFDRCYNTKLAAMISEFSQTNIKSHVGKFKDINNQTFTYNNS